MSPNPLDMSVNMLLEHTGVCEWIEKRNRFEMMVPKVKEKGYGATEAEAYDMMRKIVRNHTYKRPLLEDIEEHENYVHPTGRQIDTVKEKSAIDSAQLNMRKVFIVHGQDEEARLAVQNFLYKLGLEPIILFEELDKGRTIIEKFEDESQPAAFAIVLLTPDDIGGKQVGISDAPKLSPRARQNVVFELGFFYAKLKRQNVVALVKGHLDHPSDIHGVIYKEMDSKGAWKKDVAREMRAAGLPVDLNNL